MLCQSCNQRHDCNCRIMYAQVPAAEVVFNLSCGRFLQWLPSEGAGTLLSGECVDVQARGVPGD